MKIAIIGASGKAGRSLLKEAKIRGHKVTSIVRVTSIIEDFTSPILRKDLFDLTQADLKGFDVVIDAFATWDAQKASDFKTSIEHLIQLLDGQHTRLLVVGGAGSLYTDDSQTTQLFESDHFPSKIKLLASNMNEGLKLLKQTKTLNWSYLCPAIEFNFDGLRTGNYHLAQEVLTFNKEGRSRISYADYAIAMLDEIENNAHPNQRFSVYSD